MIEHGQLILKEFGKFSEILVGKQKGRAGG